MPLAILESHGITCEGDVLTKVGPSISWGSSLLLDVTRPNRFHFTVRILDRGSSVPSAVPALIGVAPLGYDMRVKDIEGQTGAFLFLPPLVHGFGPCKATVAAVSEEGEQVKTQLQFPGAAGVGPEPCFHVYFEDGALFFSLDDGPRVEVQLPESALGEKTYRPCVSIGAPGVRLVVSVDTFGRKRQVTEINRSRTSEAAAHCSCSDSKRTSDGDARFLPLYSFFQFGGDRANDVDGIADQLGLESRVLHRKRRRCLPGDLGEVDQPVTGVDCTGVAHDVEHAWGKQPVCYAALGPS